MGRSTGEGAGSKGSSSLEPSLGEGIASLALGVADGGIGPFGNGFD